MRKLVLAILIFFLANLNLYAKNDKIDQLNKVYSRLEVGMDLQVVRDIVEKEYPDLEIRDSYMWVWTYNAVDPEELLDWRIGLDRIKVPNTNYNAPYTKYLYRHRVILELFFNKNLQLINAAYTWYEDKKDAVENGVVTIPTKLKKAWIRKTLVPNKLK